MGDHTRLIMMEAIVAEIEREGLLALVRESGNALMAGLTELQVCVGCSN